MTAPLDFSPEMSLFSAHPKPVAAFLGELEPHLSFGI